MTDTAVLSDMSAAHTSAIGPMLPAGPATRATAVGLGLVLVVGGLAPTATASSYETPVPFERTAAGPAGRIDPAPTQTTAEAVLEIRRRSGLTWEELGDLFDVSRRSVHHWASGKPVSAEHDQIIRRTLAVLRRLDRGDAGATRALLLTPDAGGVSMLDLLKAGLFDDALARSAGAPAPERPRTPLSRAARDARRPPAPGLLLGALQDRPDIPAKPRRTRVMRAPKKKDG